MGDGRRSGSDDMGVGGPPPTPPPQPPTARATDVQPWRRPPRSPVALPIGAVRLRLVLLRPPSHSDGLRHLSTCCRGGRRRPPCSLRRSSCSSVLYEDSTSGADDEAPVSRCSLLPFDLNLPASSPKEPPPHQKGGQSKRSGGVGGRAQWRSSGFGGRVWLRRSSVGGRARWLRGSGG
ncbi:hypothetical protein OsI_05929 [Oryza sativa Indica Group]|uniref:Uncharacterized protein n=2 Tax=Oryza sativa TaxID=4530 RepID=A3A3C6_ORYSJ|nr:hypothetical protein OsI_05929 [Oryza sativa Indica Group]EAZ21815.1 hypothetical protein OsJ_05456 [Oryza sativa Japonica Group]